MPASNKRVTFSSDKRVRFSSDNRTELKYTINTSYTFYHQCVYDPNKIYSANDNRTFVRK